MWTGGLYYPYMRVRSQHWLKASALYWDSMRRFQSVGYFLRDSRASMEFSEAGLLKSVHPERYSANVSADLMRFIQANLAMLRDRFSVDAALIEVGASPNWGADGPKYGDKRLGWIHSRKISNEFAHFLVGEGLGEIGRGADVQWVGLHPTVAAAYTLALTSSCAKHEKLEPVTDNPSPFLSPAVGVAAAIRLLASGHPDAHLEEPRYDVPDFVMLAIESVVPDHLEEIEVDRILEIKNRLQEELTIFKEFVENQRRDLEGLSVIASDEIYAEAFAAHVNSAIRGPLERLERGYKLCKFDTVRSLLTLQTFTPPAAIAEALHLLHTSSVLTAVGGVGVLAGNAWWQLREERRQLIHDSPVGYLLSVKRALTARTAIERKAQLLYNSP